MHRKTFSVKSSLIIALIIFVGIIFVTGTSSCGRDPIPTKDEVGALRLPEDIEPVRAPFKMPVFKKPVFQNLSLNILEKGARQGEMVTGSIQEAIDEINLKGGGMVIIPQGVWNSGRIILKSNVNLHFEEGAELHFSGEIDDYLPVVFTRSAGMEGMSLGACIYANGEDNIAVTGKGRLFGPAMGSIKKQAIGYGSFEEHVLFKKPAEERFFDGKDGIPVFLPNFISPINCTNVYIEGLSLEQSAFWNIVPVYCDGVIIRGVTVNSYGIPSGDGIDIESSRNVLIEYCTLTCGDDCYTMKAGRGEDGLRVNRPTENVVLRYSLAKQGHGGVTCGSETAGMVRNLYVHDCVFDETDIGIRFKTRRPRGGGGEKLYYERIRMNLRKAVINVDMLGSSIYVGDMANRMPLREVNSLTPQFRDIEARDLIVEQAAHFLRIDALPEAPLINFKVKDSEINCNILMRIHDSRGIFLENINIQSADSIIEILDSSDITFKRLKFKLPDDRISMQISGELSDNIRFRKCTPEKPADWPTTVYESKTNR